jgi:hypothetical protein
LQSTLLDCFWWSSFTQPTSKTTKALISFCTESKKSSVDLKWCLLTAHMASVVCLSGRKRPVASSCRRCYDQ